MLLSFLWGLLLGLFYFCGLWLTVCHMIRTSWPKTLWLTSFALRMVLSLAGMWWVLQESLAGFCVALAAFFTVRFFLSRRIGAPLRKSRPPNARHVGSDTHCRPE